MKIGYIVFVPYWGSLFQNKFLACGRTNRHKFSSPTGVLYFKIRSAHFQKYNPNLRFRPLLGFFISKCLRKVEIDLENRFSSPTGVLYFKIELQFNKPVVGNGFRPLLGFFISKCLQYISVPESRGVFVPCWGSLFQNNQYSYYDLFSLQGFRPLLGFFISKFHSPFLCFSFLVTFSSPAGVLYFKI